MLKIVVLFIGVAAIGADRNAKTNTFQNEQKDANYNYRFDTSNGIFSLETGVGGVSTSGASQYISPDGTPVHFSYTADERGYIAEGSHIPTPHPIPKYILDSLEHNRLNPQEDDSQNQNQQYQQTTQTQQAQQQNQQVRTQLQTNQQTGQYNNQQSYQQQYHQQQAHQTQYTVQQKF